MSRFVLLPIALGACAPYFRADEERTRRAMDERALQDTLDAAAAAGRSGQHQRAADLYVDAIERNPRLPGKVYFALANELFDAGQLGRSVAVARFAMGRRVSEPVGLAASDQDVESLAARFDAASQPALAAELRALQPTPAP